MSESGKHRRVSSGEFTRLAAREQADGSIEYVMEDVATLEEASETGLEPLPMAPEPSKRGFSPVLGAAALAAILVSLGVGWALMRAPKSAKSAGAASAASAGSFQPYRGDVRKSVSPAAPKVAPSAPKIKPAPAELSEEERRAWELAERTGQEVIVEEEGADDPAPKSKEEVAEADIVTPGIGKPRSSAGQPPMWKRKTQIDANTLRAARRANPTQRALLKKLNTMDPAKFKPRKRPLHELYRVPATPVQLSNSGEEIK